MNLIPWLTDDFVHTFEGWPTREWVMFEWGAGGSTIWFGKRVKKLVSLEHDKEWFEEVQVHLEAEKGLPVDLFFFPLSDPLYIDKILEYEPFDCILVDGRNRVKCGLNALKRLKPGGILILDNADRDEYGELISAADLVGKRTRTSNGIWRTDYWSL